jgi:hypothetical protein
VEKVQTAKECADKPFFAKCDLIVRANFCNKGSILQNSISAENFLDQF